MKITQSFLVYIASLAVPINAIDSSILKQKVGDGGATSVKFSSVSLMNNENPCSPWALCEGSSLHHIFDPDKKSICLNQSTDEDPCTQFKIISSFGKEWEMKYFTLVSSEVDSSFDPSRIIVEGSNSYDSTTGQGDWTKIFDSGVNSNALSSDRSAKNDFPVENDDTYRHYSLTIEKKEDSSKIHIGHFGLVQSYLMKYVSELIEDITGHNVLEPITHAPSDSPTTTPTTGVRWVKGAGGETCNQACNPLGLSCSSEKQTEMNTYEKVRDAFKEAGYTCKGAHVAMIYTGAPFSTGRGDDCAPFGGTETSNRPTNGGKSSCDANYYPNHSPLCACV